MKNLLQRLKHLEAITRGAKLRLLLSKTVSSIYLKASKHFYFKDSSFHINWEHHFKTGRQTDRARPTTDF